jgi:hypothetical protein
MKTPLPEKRRARYRLRWTARLLSLAAFCVLLAFIFGEGFNPLRFETRELILSLFFPLGVGLGLLIAWRWEAIGGWLTLGSVAAFYLIHFLLSGSLPKGWVLVTFGAPGALFLGSSCLRTGTRGDRGRVPGS